MDIVAVIGDGQLARMMQTAAIELGQSIRVLAATPAASAAQVTADVQLGDYTSYDDLIVAAQDADAITFDHEHVPNEHLQKLIDAGYNVQPQPSALIYAQDKLEMRRKLESIGAPVPAYAAIETVEDARAFAERVDGRVCLDLPYEEDSRAEVDLNVVMNESGNFVEVQGTGEHGLFGREQLDAMLDSAEKGCSELIAAQKAALGW